MKTLTLIVVFATALFGQQDKKKIAVWVFDDSTIANRSARQTGENQAVGQKIADTLIGKLAESGTFQVVDRQHLQDLIREQNLKHNERFDESAAAKIGKLAHVDAIVTGTVNAFSVNTSQKTTGNFVSKKLQTIGSVQLKVTARVINVETGAILAAPTASGDVNEVLAEQKSSELLQGVGSNNSVGNLGNAINALVDKSVEASATSLAQSISAKAASISAINSSGVATQAQYKVVGVSDGQTFVNKGKNAGLKPGDMLQVYRVVSTGLTDPDSGKPITKRKGVCVLTVSEVEDSSASGSCKGETAQAADIAEPARE